MTIPYNPTVPQGIQQINNTQSPIEINFQSIADYVEVNHAGFNLALEGRHTFVSYVQQSADPSTSANEMALYSKYVSGDTNLMEMFYRYPSNGSVVQLTGFTNYSDGTNGGSIPYHQGTTGSTIDTWAQGYWQYMSNGILLMVWVPSNVIASGQSYAAGVAIPVAIPSGYGAPTFSQTPFNIQYVTNYTGSTLLNDCAVAAIATSPTTMNVYNSYAVNGTSGPNTFALGYFMAIGV